MDPSILEEMLNSSWTKTINSMPANIQKRTKGLQGIQEEHHEIKQQELKELRELKEKLITQCEPWWEERRKIVAGEGSVTEEMTKGGRAFLEKKMEDSDDEEDDKPEPVDVKTAVTDCVKNGIPDFWLKVLQGAESLDEMIQEWDIPVLKHLTDVTCIDKEESLQLIFHFSKNEYFTNEKLFKTMLLEYDNTLADYNVTSSSGTEISWCSGKNVTQKVEKKRKKKGGQTSFVTKTKPQDSFFSFFSDSLTEDDDEEDEHDEEFEQMEIAVMFKDLVIPRAVELYCGEINDDMDDDEESEEGSSDEDDSDDEKPAKKGSKDEKPAEECKQQ